MYCVMAERLYGRPINKKDNPKERQMGKVLKLAPGYGMGGEKYVTTVRVQTKQKISLGQGKAAIKVYRAAHSMVLAFWERGEQALFAILKGEIGRPVDSRGIIVTCEGGLLMPNGMAIKYPELQYHGKKNFDTEEVTGFTYFNGKSRVNIYGGKVVENIVQALARTIVLYQCAAVKPWPWVMTSHDEGVWVVPEAEADTAKRVVTEALCMPLPWCIDLPLNCEVGYDQSYGRAKP